MMSDQDAASLENQLRSMILSNVTISNTQVDHRAHSHLPHQHSPRGRGRGRDSGSGLHHRGGRNHESFAGRGQFPIESDVAHSSARGRWRASVPQRGRGHPQSRLQSNPSSPTAGGHLVQPAPQDILQDPRAPRQSHPQEGRLGAQASQPPQILQRPRTNADTATSNMPSRGQTARYNQRRGGPHHQHMNQPMEDPIAQVTYLDQLASEEIPKAEIKLDELEEKEAFRNRLEKICQTAFAESYDGDIATIALVGFGSLASGFAMPESDMDLAIMPGWKDPSKALEVGIDREIPRILEHAILNAQLGGRLLTRTRVPILKVCQTPTDELYNALFEERQKWDELSEEEKYPSTVVLPEPHPNPPIDVDGQKTSQPVLNSAEFPTLSGSKAEANGPQQSKPKTSNPDIVKEPEPPTTPLVKEEDAKLGNTEKEEVKPKEQPRRNEKPWLREKTLGPLDFPKTGVGIQCDINFENPLGIHNTHLLRCYSYCDPRVRPIVLFIKAWAKRRKINSSYSGTLSSYGWVLMVLHYLVNIAQPPVCPNLQSVWRPAATSTDVQGLEQMFKDTMVGGYAVRFWRNETEILHAARSGQLSSNRQSVGGLLRGFFQYYASVQTPFGYGPRTPSFYWTNEVLSLRTPGGIRSKSEKGWTGAKTTISNGKEVRHRYLFCIEDPFELDHNVARTVTHFGIVAIRDEFRRAWRVVSAIGKGQQPEGGIFDEVVEQKPPPTPTKTDEEERPMVTEVKPAGNAMKDEVGEEQKVEAN